MMRLHRHHSLVLAFALPMLSFVAGCGGEEPSTKPKLKTRETLNKTTQDVRDLKTELANGGILADTQIQVADPLTQMPTPTAPAWPGSPG